MDNLFAKVIGQGEQKRLPKFAGTWYPAQPQQLNHDLDNYLQKAASKLSKEQKEQDILAVIVPHAGYMYSGQTAAFAYSTLKGKKYKRVFLLGPSHFIPFKGIALPSEKIFSTPLGDLEIDRQTINNLLQHPYFHKLENVFDCEHSLEMQLPWIFKTLGKVKLIPMAIGAVSTDQIEKTALTIKEQLKESDLIIISSDFTHYGPRFDYEPFAGEPFSVQREKIKTLDLQAFDCLREINCSHLLKFYEHTHDTICGIYPCSILLSLLPHDSQARLLHYSTSQDTEAHNMQKELDNSSVSYMAIAFSRNKKTPSTDADNGAFSAEDGSKILEIARLTLEDYLAGIKKEPAEYKKLLDPDQLNHFMEKRGVFVTLYEQSAQHKQKLLRGCIGYIYPKEPFLNALCENAINAASTDPRFYPVGLQELNQLTIEVNVLTTPKPIETWQKIKLGQDGIVLSKDGHQAVFLPQVAHEFGWDLPQTLSQLAMKAGLPANAWQKNAHFEVFQSQLFSEQATSKNP